MNGKYLVKNKTNHLVERAGIQFPSGVEKEVLLANWQYPLVNACKALTMKPVGEKATVPSAATTSEAGTTALDEAVVKKDEAEGEGDYECRYCPYSSKTAAGRAAHERMKHPEVTPEQAEKGA